MSSNNTVKELRKIAKNIGVNKYYSLRKNELINEISKSLQAVSSRSLQSTPLIPPRTTSLIHRPIPLPRTKVNGNPIPLLRSKLNINNPDIVYLFSGKGKKEHNDRDNKLRERIIENIINNPEYYKKFIKHKEFYKNLCKKLKQTLSKLYIDEYDEMRLKRMAGRQFNYDFKLYFYKNKEIVETVNIEFKVGALTVSECPQFYQKDVKGIKLFKNSHYTKYFYDNIDEFIEAFPEDISNILKENKPKTYNAYLKIVNDVKYRHPFQKTIYEFNKKNPDKKMKHKLFIDEQIKTYLSNKKITDVAFDEIKRVLFKQENKVYLLYKKNNFYIERINCVNIKENKFSIKNNNTLLFESEQKNNLLFLLRWKNHKGVAMPAWQVSLKRKA